MMEGLTVTDVRGGEDANATAMLCLTTAPKKDGINRCGVILCSLPFYPKIWPDFGALS